ncbi:MAG: hypothetical protein QW303_01695 [Nitrososphaerota archaeon]
MGFISDIFGTKTEVRTSVDVINEAIVDVIFEVAQRCSAEAAAVQKIEYTGFSFFTFAKQKVGVSLECLQQVKIDANIINEMVAKIKQEAAANNIAFSLTDIKVGIDNKIKNLLTTRLKTNFVQECTVKAKAIQEIGYRGFTIFAYAENIIELTKKCMMETLTNLRIAQDLVADVNQVVQAKVESPFQFLADMFTSFWSYIVLGIILIVTLVILFGSEEKVES